MDRAALRVPHAPQGGTLPDACRAGSRRPQASRAVQRGTGEHGQLHGAQRSPASPRTRRTRAPASSSRIPRPANRPACCATPRACSSTSPPASQVAWRSHGRRQEAVPQLQRVRHHQHRRPQRRPRIPRPVPRAGRGRRTDRAHQRLPAASAPTARARRSPAASTRCRARTAAADRRARAASGCASARSSSSSTAACSTAPRTCASPGRQGDDLPDRRERLPRPAVRAARTGQDPRRGSGDAQAGRSPPTAPAKGRWTCCSTPTSSSTGRRRSRTCASASRTPTSRRSTISSAAGSSAFVPTCSRPGSTRTATRWPASSARNASAGSSRTRAG